MLAKKSFQNTVKQLPNTAQLFLNRKNKIGETSEAAEETSRQNMVGEHAVQCRASSEDETDGCLAEGVVGDAGLLVQLMNHQLLEPVANCLSSPAELLALALSCRPASQCVQE